MSSSDATPVEEVFEVNERILCYHGPLIYEAKVLNVNTKAEDGPLYKVHYNGWKRTWDQWVKADRMLKLNEAGIQKQSEVADQHRRGKKPVKLRCSGVPSFSERNRRETSTPPSNSSAPSPQLQTSTSTTSVSSSARKSDRSNTPTFEITVSETDTESPVTTRKRGRLTRSGTDSTLTSPTTTAVPDSTVVESSPDVASRSHRSKASVGGGQSEKGRKSAASSDAETSSQRGDRVEGTMSSRSTKKRSSATTAAPSEGSDRTTGTRTSITLRGSGPQLESHVQSRRAYLEELSRDVRIEIPDGLKCWLFDDWDLITRQHRLMSLPASVTVDDALSDYVQLKRSERMKGRSKKKRVKLETGGTDEESTASTDDDAIMDDVVVFTDGLREYFNAMLGCQLLYPLERVQYGEMMRANEGKPVSSIYGVGHLLRMLTRLGGALSQTTLNGDSCGLIVGMCDEFVLFLEKKRRCEETEGPVKGRYFFQGDYASAPHHYHQTT